EPIPALGRLGGLRRENERAPGGAPSFAESVSLSSTVLADSRLPPNAFEIGFDLLALRARREREPMASGGSAQEARDRKSPQIRRTSSWTALHARQRNVAVKCYKIAVVSHAALTRKLCLGVPVVLLAGSVAAAAVAAPVGAPAVSGPRSTTSEQPLYRFRAAHAVSFRCAFDSKRLHACPARFPPP